MPTQLDHRCQLCAQKQTVPLHPWGPCHRAWTPVVDHPPHRHLQAESSQGPRPCLRIQGRRGHGEATERKHFLPNSGYSPCHHRPKSNLHSRTQNTSFDPCRSWASARPPHTGQQHLELEDINVRQVPPALVGLRGPLPLPGESSQPLSGRSGTAPPRSRASYTCAPACPLLEGLRHPAPGTSQTSHKCSGIVHRGATGRENL